MRRSRIVLFLVLAALAAGVVAWLLRDLPRLRTRALLATALDADVGLAGVEVQGRGSFVLHDLVIERPAAAPWVRRAELERVAIEGSLAAIRAGRLERITVTGGVVHLEPMTAGEGPAGEGGGGLAVGEMILSDLEVVFHALGQSAAGTLEGELEGELADPTATLRLRSASMRLLPLVAFVLGEERLEPLLARSRLALEEPYPDVRATVTVSPGEPLRVSASGGGRLSVGGRAGERVRLPFPDLEVTVERLPGSFTPRRVTLDVGLRGVGQIDAVLARQGDGLAPVEVAVDARHADVVLRAFDLLPDGWEIDGPAWLRLEQRRPGESLYAYRATADLTRLELPAGETRLVALGAGLEAHGTLRIDRLDQATPLVAQLLLPDLRTADGELPSGLRRLEIDFDGTFDPGAGVDLRGEATVRTASLGTVSGDGTLSLGGDGSRADLDWRWQDADLEQLVVFAAELGSPLPFAVTDGEVTASGRLVGPLDAPTVAGFLHGTASTIRTTAEDGSPMLLRDVSLDTNLRLSGGQLRLEGTRLAGLATAAGLEEQRFELSAGGAVDLATRRLELGDSRLDLAGIGRLDLAGAWSPDDGFAGRATLAALEPAWVDSILRSTLDDLVPPGWSYSLDAGIDSGAGLAVELRGETWSLDGVVTLGDVELASEDGSRVVQVADSRWRVEGGGALGGERDATETPTLSLVATSELPGFVLLWGSIFADYGDLAAEARVELTASTLEDGGRAWRGRVELLPDPALRFAAGFGVAPEEPVAYEASLVATDLAPVFARFVRQPLADSIPALAGVSAAGHVELALAGEVGEGGRTAAGRLLTRDLELEVAARDLTLRDLDLLVPIDLRWGPAIDGVRDLGGDTGTGTLRFAGLEMGEIAVGEIATRLVVVADHVELERPLELALLGGRLRLEHLALAELARPTRELRTGLVLEGLDLGQIAGRFGLELEGELSGDFPDVRASGDEFEVEGGGELAVFGGTVTVSEISGEEIFSDLPKLQLDARFEGLRLEQLTRSFDFGEVSGVARGYVHHLVLFGGTPVRFDGELETVRVPGVPRRITLKAIENISILGTGGLPAGLGSTFLRIFDRYRYQKIGAHLTLSNDVFLMRGLAERGGKELFMKGRFPPIRIDIVNASPGRTVSFSTMLERLEYADVSRGDAGPRRP